MNIRRKFRSKNSRFANFVDIENDFGGSDLEAYRGPKLKKHETVTPAWIEQLQTFFVTKQGRMHRKYVYKLLCLSEEYYRRSNTVLIDIELPTEAVINICGDIHGQLFDLIKILKLQGRF